jgi:hypothetical protein
MDAKQMDDGSLLLDLVDFKWLMATRGWRINLTRMSSDTEYACLWARRGMESGEALLARQGAALMARLSPQLPA